MGLVYEDDRVLLIQGSTSEKILAQVRQQAETYLEAWTRKAWTILYKGERRFRPSAIAISCVLASRRVAGINPILSDRLKEMTLLEECYDDSVYEEIGECYELVCS
jgi:hypothetical protein